MEDRRVSLSQVGSSGTLLLETDFGLTLAADFSLNVTPQSRRSASRLYSAAMIMRPQAVRALSPCCGRVHEKRDEVFFCPACSKVSAYPQEAILFSLLDGQGRNELETLLDFHLRNPLEATLRAEKLQALLRWYFTRVEQGHRTRVLVDERPEASI